MTKERNFYSYFLAAITVWGVTAYHYINIGMSVIYISAITYFILKKLTGKGFPYVKIERDFWLAALFIYGSVLLSSLFHLDNLYNIYGGHYSVISFIMYSLPLWILLLVGWDEDVRKPIYYTFLVVCYSMCLYGIWKCFFYGENRLDSYYTSPTHVGIMLDMFIPFTIAFWNYYRDNLLYLYVNSVLVIIEIIALFMTETRGSFLALSAAFIFSIISYIYKNHIHLTKINMIKIAIAILLVIGITIGYSFCLGNGNMSRMKGGERLLMWEASYHMWSDHKLVGVGIDEWKAMYEGPYRQVNSHEAGINVMPHNMFIYFFATGGVIAGVGYLGYLWFMLRYLWKRIWLYSSNPFSWCMLAVFIAFAVHGLLDETFISKTMGRIFYMLLGIAILFERMDKKSEGDYE